MDIKKSPKLFVPNKKITYFVIIFFVLLISILFSYRYMKVSNTDNSALVLLEQTEGLLSEWEESQKNTINSESNLDKISSNLSQLDTLSIGSVLSARLNFLKGLFFIKIHQKYDEAIQSFSKIPSGVYQYNPSLLYQASIWEMKGDLKKALEKYKELSTVKSSFYKVQGIFYQAILSEKLEDYVTAERLYAKIAEEYMDSTWQKLASNRLLYLNIFK